MSAGEKVSVCLASWYREVTAVQELDVTPLPSDLNLVQNFPNPFNMGTTIDFSLRQTSEVHFEIFNVLGQRVKTLVDETLEPGNYRTTWDGTDECNEPVSSGVYFYRIQTGQIAKTKKMILMK